MSNGKRSPTTASLSNLVTIRNRSSSAYYSRCPYVGDRSRNRSRSRRTARNVSHRATRLVVRSSPDSSVPSLLHWVHFCTDPPSSHPRSSSPYVSVYCDGAHDERCHRASVYPWSCSPDTETRKSPQAELLHQLRRSPSLLG